MEIAEVAKCSDRAVRKWAEFLGNQFDDIKVKFRSSRSHDPADYTKEQATMIVDYGKGPIAARRFREAIGFMYRGRGGVDEVQRYDCQGVLLDIHQSARIGDVAEAWGITRQQTIGKLIDIGLGSVGGEELVELAGEEPEIAEAVPEGDSKGSDGKAPVIKVFNSPRQKNFAANPK
jgi:hypothetical protein